MKGKRCPERWTVYPLSSERRQDDGQRPRQTGTCKDKKWMFFFDRIHHLRQMGNRNQLRVRKKTWGSPLGGGVKWPGPADKAKFLKKSGFLSSQPHSQRACGFLQLHSAPRCEGGMAEKGVDSTWRLCRVSAMKRKGARNCVIHTQSYNDGPRGLI